MADSMDVEVPCKRIKLLPDTDVDGQNNEIKPSLDKFETEEHIIKQNDTENVDLSLSKDDPVEKSCAPTTSIKVFPIHTKETDVGITEYISKRKGFHGVLKQRFVDFLVNERDTKGNLVELTHTNVPLQLEEGDETSDILNKEEIQTITTVLESNDKSFTITLKPDDDKEHRTLTHKAIKKKFPELDTETVTVDGHKAIKVYRYQGNPAKKRRDKWPSNQGNFCKFVLHKENKDTMEAICLLAKLVHVKNSSFSYAGTKDRRGVTSQEVRAYRVQAQRLKGLNKTLKGILLGNFEYVNESLTLGQLSGNHFVITLRDVSGSRDEIEEAMNSMRDVGFINYFGLQRFGTAAVPTHHIGRALLLSKWAEAVHAILSPKTGKEHEFNDALQLWRETGDAAKALEILSRHKCIENTLLQGLVKHGSKDLVNALQFIPRNTRLMYIHAYQSYIWNNVVSWRIQQYGLYPVEGDLVFLGGQGADCRNREQILDDSYDNEEAMTPTPRNASVKTLTTEDVKSGQYSIHDVVLPQPGYDVVYPGYNAKQIYKDLMSQDGIDIDGLRHRVKDYSLVGAYRRMVIKPQHTCWRFLRYNDVSEPLVLTDRDKYEGKTSLEVPTDGEYLALQIELTLPSSCYATMAVREIMKCETSSSHQATLNKV